ncbi:MAG TPA: ribosomal protein S18-alanine N-acetyltransferase [Gemmatimonadales bacterium]|nr:ribosomal protein S18-alanine N-acetyltransferase [Gemmatimonadales bacterium]
MDAPYRTRPATSADAPALAALERAAFADPWSAASLREVLAADSSFGFVAEDGGAVVGYGLGRIIADDGEILNLAVAEEHRHRGVGRSLLGSMLARFDTGPVRQVFLEVREGNLAAVTLYRGAGFVQVGRRAEYYRDPVEAALVLRRGRTPLA